MKYHYVAVYHRGRVMLLCGAAYNLLLLLLLLLKSYTKYKIKIKE